MTRLNRELARAKSVADEANISKTRFLAAASHDILQPLNAARLYATSLVERERKGDEAKLAANVDASLEAVEEILAVLLDISRLDSGAMQPEISSLRVDDILSQLEVEFAPLAHEKGLKLVFLPCSLTVRTDRRFLRRLLQNLVANAIKYTSQGRVLVGCRRGDKSLRIEVIDTGMGIPTNKQEVIFKEFQRLDQGAQVARGLGLGLSIVERIARILDHKITLRSEVGKGSAFTVELPTGPSIPRTSGAQASAVAAVIPLNSVSVLCIDNNSQVLEGMKALLGGWGCHVMGAAGFEDAMQTLRSGGRPDVLLVDYHLDDGDGLQTIAAVRAKLGDDTPAALVTADRSAIVRDKARADEVSVLHKPLKPAILRAFLAQWRVARPAAE